jgi:hypothetical protein
MGAPASRASYTRGSTALVRSQSNHPSARSLPLLSSFSTLAL